ncbi:hypothetical protein [Winogradskyella sp.]|uniref:hypothetical protein n=1 Tax=Winogradskyella sp. TaxID=1883156 RepID=UPI001B1C2FC3|nr:hypothetical protein [Winogradskyella sp.]MBO6879249.1 hypothetical protein [Winogradskyella sp.]
MKNIRLILVSFLLIAFIGCEEDERGTQFVDNADAPSDVSLQFRTTQDNSGLVTITPTAVGATQFEIALGDGTGDTISLEPGESIDNVYAEGTYTVGVTATSINGLITQAEQQLVVSFQAPQNLVVTIENDAAISKQVNVTATADFAMSYDVYFGEPGNDTPLSANIGEGVSYIYQEAGTYTITVIAMGSAIETTTYTEEFEVTEILAPLNSAPIPPARAESDVVSIFSDVYTDVTLDELPTTWSSATFEATSIDTDNIWKLTSLDFLGIVTNYANGIDVSAMETLHIDYWVPSGQTNELLVKIVNTIDGGEDIESLGDTVGGSWQSIDIDMSGFDGGDLANTEKITQILIDSDGISGVVYVDNFYFYREGGAPLTCTMVEDFEGTPPTFTVFGDIADTQVVANPDQSGENTTGNVAQLTKSSGSQPWAGTFFDISSPLDFSSCTNIRVKTWSPKLGAVVKLKVEDSANGDNSFEVDLNTTVTNQWEELVFDFSAAPNFNYDRVVIFFDFGVPGDDSVYYYDEIEVIDNGGSTPGLSFQDFEGTPPAFTVFGDIADTQVVANPDQSGLNTTGNVAQLTKTSGSQPWAGTFFDVSQALDLTNYTKIRMKVWSPKLGAVVKLKVEDSTNGDNSFEVDLVTTTTNEWEELTYDFSAAPAFNYDRVVVFFDFGVPGDDSVYYFDEMELTN